MSVKKRLSALIASETGLLLDLTNIIAEYDSIAHACDQMVKSLKEQVFISIHCGQEYTRSVHKDESSCDVPWWNWRDLKQLHINRFIYNQLHINRCIYNIKTGTVDSVGLLPGCY